MHSGPQLLARADEDVDDDLEALEKGGEDDLTGGSENSVHGHSIRSVSLIR